MRFCPPFSAAASLIALLSPLILSACAGTPTVVREVAPATGAADKRISARETVAPVRPPTALPASAASTLALPPVTEPPVPDPETNVFFASGSDTISSAARVHLAAVVDRLKARPRADITLVGHTDDTGSSELNIALAQKRVAAVAAELQALGIPSRQIRRVSYGNEASGAHSCQTPQCRQQERRVELRISGSD